MTDDMRDFSVRAGPIHMLRCIGARNDAVTICNAENDEAALWPITEAELIVLSTAAKAAADQLARERNDLESLAHNEAIRESNIGLVESLMPHISAVVNAVAEARRAPEDKPTARETIHWADEDAPKPGNVGPHGIE